MNRLILLVLFFAGCAQDNSGINIPVFDQNRAFQYLLDQCSFGPRNPGSDGHKNFAIHLEKYLVNLSSDVIVQEFIYNEHITGIERKGKNFIIQFNKASKERILIGAHWDTRALSDQDLNEENRNIPILGANDGASGSAVLMELANIFSNENPPVGIDLVFFDAEDVGIDGQPTTYAMGSEYFSKNLPIKKPNSGIIVDMVGDKNLKIPIERFSYQIDKDKVKELWSLANELSLSAFEYNIGYEIYDDHVPLWENAKIPTIDIIDFDYPNLFYNHWHTQNDVPENCSPQSLGQVGTLLVNYIYGKTLK
ncbi:MAG: M28 family peptidase [Candidatus Neomarinimicrobiota bacterium]